MTETLLALDPGHVTGWSTWLVDNDVPLMRLEYGLIRGGVYGVVDWMQYHLAQLKPAVTACEDFRLGGDVIDPNIEPLLIKGALIATYSALGLSQPIWQPRSDKALVRDAVLKRAGLWLYGSDPAIDWTDAADVNDSQRHALIWARAADHYPTIERFWPRPID